MKCNIDSTGRMIRLLSGILLTGVGLAVLTTNFIADPSRSWGWFLGSSLLVIGGFQIFEAWAGWCVVRAMGIRTRI